MRSFRKLAALSVAGAACSFFALPAFAATLSLWDHNGSLMRLEENGKKRKFIYDQPKSGLTTAGIKTGAVLFDGEEKADGRLSGYAKLFRKGCDPVDYFVEGAFDKDKGELLLQGQAPIYSGEGCKITGYSEENASSSLVFRYQSGGNAPIARNDYLPPENLGRRPAPYGTVPPEDVGGRPAPYGTLPPEDVGGGADADPNAPSPPPADFAEDPYADPRNGSREYPPRDFADQRDQRLRPYSRYDGADPVPVDPADSDDDVFYEEDDAEEPAYVPFRSWRQN